MFPTTVGAVTKTHTLKNNHKIMKLVSVLLVALVFGTGTTVVAGVDDNVAAATGNTTSLSSTHRSLLFANLFRSRRQRSCVQTEQELREKVALGGTVDICRGTTITVQAKIDMTGQSFDLQCESARSLLRLWRPRRQRQTCVISGAETTHLFEGSPTLASFQDIEFRNGKNANGGQAGGAVFQSGGVSSFERCTFAANQATVRARTLLECALEAHMSTQKQLTHTFTKLVWRRPGPFRPVPQYDPRLHL